MTNTTAVYKGTFVNHGTYNSDPSTNVFEAGLTVGATGVLTGGSGDVFEIRGSFLNGSTDAAGWNTDDASLRLVLDDPSGATAFEWSLAGIDVGQSAGGLTGNFSFIDVFVDIGPDDTLLISDGNADPGAAFYTRVFQIDLADLLLIASDFNVYYDGTLAQNAYLGCAAHSFGSGGGQLLAYNATACGGSPTGVSEPGTLPLLAGSLLLLLGVSGLRRRVF